LSLLCYRPPGEQDTRELALVITQHQFLSVIKDVPPAKVSQAMDAVLGDFLT